MPKKQAGLPDLKTRFGWLPGGNRVDPQIYTQLDPTLKKPLPDYNTQDTQGAQQPDNTFRVSQPPGVNLPGGGPPGGPGPTYPPPPPPPPQPLPPPVGSGQTWEPPRPTMPNFPTVSIGPVGSPPPGPPPLPPGPTVSMGPTAGSPVTPPPTPPTINMGPIGSPSSPSLNGPTVSMGPTGSPAPGPVGPTMGMGPVSLPPGGTPPPPPPTTGGTDVTSTFDPYQGPGDSGGPPQGPGLGTGGWTLPWEPPVPPPPPAPTGGTDITTTMSPYGGGDIWTVPPDTPPTGDVGGTESDGGAGEGNPDDLGQKPDEGDQNPGEMESAAMGGVFMKPRIARVGERGPEAIMKLGPRMPGGWEVPMRPGKLPYEGMRYKRRSEVV